MKWWWLLVALSVHPWALSCEKSSEQILLMVENGDAPRVIREVWPSSDCEETIASGIASGSERWIRAAVELHMHTDAGDSEFIKASLGEAMLTAPSRVLRLVGTMDFPAEMICLPWMTDDSGASDARYEAILADAIKMFHRFDRTQLRFSARRCLAHAEEVKKSLVKRRAT
jgi:hypothetical protein